MSKLKDRAIGAINRERILLVFPIKNSQLPKSIWSVLFPRSEMKWEWDEDADNRVVQLWHLREELSRSSEVVYAKWYRDRATFFSREIFPYFLRALNVSERPRALSREAQNLWDCLEDNSPVATRSLKKAAGLYGRENEASYQRALKELWQRLLIVGFGEKNEGAFPSLQMASTRLLFEDLWAEAFAMSQVDAFSKLKEWGFEQDSWTLFLKKLIMKQDDR